MPRCLVRYASGAAAVGFRCSSVSACYNFFRSGGGIRYSAPWSSRLALARFELGERQHVSSSQVCIVQVLHNTPSMFREPRVPRPPAYTYRSLMKLHEDTLRVLGLKNPHFLQLFWYTGTVLQGTVVESMRYTAHDITTKHAKQEPKKARRTTCRYKTMLPRIICGARTEQDAAKSVCEEAKATQNKYQIPGMWEIISPR